VNNRVWKREGGGGWVLCTSKFHLQILKRKNVKYHPSAPLKRSWGIHLSSNPQSVAWKWKWISSRYGYPQRTEFSQPEYRYCKDYSTVLHCHTARGEL